MSRPLEVGRQRRLAHAARRALLRPVPGGRELPSYLIIGAKRAGTTSLNEYLVQHPHVVRGLVEKGSRYFDVNYDRGWRWFESNLPLSRSVDTLERRLGTRPIVGESSPFYSVHPEAVARIARHLPESRLIMLVRDPVERAWSQFRYETKRGFEDLPIHAALDAEVGRLADPDPEQRLFALRHHSYVTRSLYADQIERLQYWSDADRLLVMDSERLFSDPATAMDGVHSFLGLAPYHGEYSVAHKANESSPVPGDVRSRLEPFFVDANRRLASIMADRAPDWSRR